MRRWSLALLVTLASPALAQAPEPAAEPAQAPPAAPAAEAKPPPTEVKPAPAETKAPAAAAAPAPAVKPTPPPEAPAPAAAAPAPVPKPQAAPPAPAAPAPQVADKDLDAEGFRRKMVKTEARFLLENLITGDVRHAAGELAYPFQLEDKRYNTPEELVAAWVKQLRAKRTDLMSLYDIEVFSIAEMEKKYGKAPARLGLGSLKDPDAI